MRTAHVPWARPALTERYVPAGTLVSPNPGAPQQASLTDSKSAQVCVPPALTETTLGPGAARVVRVTSP